ncbi:hypothetical protein L2E82_16642 [Cichorium intybus]|uniref:Uncharacterized protein n=1 Tax=Cichorium intybus TaxID=13427 RepID=A0ACB9F737_CICIN|nr:hypothetical protein L2E82_16642 [Cichorium intybus]
MVAPTTFLGSGKARIQVLTRAQTSHPLDPLSAAEIKVAVATVTVAGHFFGCGLKLSFEKVNDLVYGFMLKGIGQLPSILICYVAILDVH